MKVKMLTTYAGPLGAFNAGATPDVSAELAQTLIDAGAAEVIGGVAVDPVPPAVEVASTQESLLPLEPVAEPSPAANVTEDRPARGKKGKA